MHLVLGAGAVNGLYSAGNPQTGQRPTALDRRDFNTVFSELANLVQGAGFALNELDDSQVLQSVLRLAAGRQLLRNLLINGDFRLWQRGESALTVSAGAPSYGPDRWFINNNVNDVARPFQVQKSGTYAGGASTTPFEQTIVPRFQAGNYPGDVMSFGQRIENAATASGEEVTLSFWARTSEENSGVATEADLQPVLRQYHGTGGSPAVDVETLGPTFRLTRTWQRFEWTVTLPTIGALGTDGWPLETMSSDSGANEIKSYLELRFDLDNWNGSAPTNVRVNVGLVQLERGPTASDFERRPLELELQFARRYYEKSMGFAQSPSSSSWPMYEGAAAALHSGTVAVGLNTRFRASKVRVPFVSFINPDNGTGGGLGGLGQIIWNSVAKNVDSLLYTSTESTGIPVVTGSSTNSPVYGHWEADAEYY